MLLAQHLRSSTLVPSCAERNKTNFATHSLTISAPGAAVLGAAGRWFKSSLLYHIFKGLELALSPSPRSRHGLDTVAREPIPGDPKGERSQSVITIDLPPSTPTANVTTPKKPPSQDIEERLRRVRRLLENNLITPDEAATKRKEILGEF